MKYTGRFRSHRIMVKESRGSAGVSDAGSEGLQENSATRRADPFFRQAAKKVADLLQLGMACAAARA